MKRQLFLSSVIFLLALQSLFASAPLRRIFSYPQADGTRISVKKQGDNHQAFYATTDGLALIKKSDGSFYYALATTDGITTSSILAHNEGERNAEELEFIKSEALTSEAYLIHLSPLRPSAPNTRSLMTGNDGLGTYGTSAMGALKSIGSPNIPIVLVEFPDMKFLSDNTPEKFMRWFNETGYSDEQYCKGSVAQYFSSQSDSLFTPRFTVVGKVMLSKNYVYYGKDASGGSTDAKMSEFVKETLDSLKKKEVNLASHLSDDKIPLIVFIHAGPGQQSSFESNCDDYLYAHFKEMSGTKYDGKSIASYLCTCELLQSYTEDASGLPVVTGAQIDGIGTFCHELNHALGLPDFYSTRNTKVETPDIWSIMDYGQYNYDGYRPAGFSAYERSYLGWLDIEELNDVADYKELYPLDTEGKPCAYLLRNAANSKEYFVLENRQPGLWFPTFFGTGMLVTHIDYDSSIWNANVVNTNASHPRVSIVRADNNFQNVTYEDFYNVVKGDLYPGTTENTELSDVSTPSTNVFTGNGLGKPIYNIRMSDEGVISFSYLDNTLTGISTVEQKDGDSSRLYTIDGTLIFNGEESPNFKPGIYIKVSGNTTKKILIP